MKAKAEILPDSHLVALHNAGFTVVSYLDKCVRVNLEGQERTEWLPRLCVAPSPSGKGYRVIEWLPACHPSNAYGFDGWSPVDNHAWGGMCKTVGQALSWFDWHEKQRHR
jgi:hypothetical protein